MRIWKQTKLQLKKGDTTIEPLHESICPFITELHVLWITTPQVYDVCDLHHTPHYSLTFEETQNLLHLLQYTNITIVEYFTNKNYIGDEYRIQITNVFDNKNIFTTSEIDYVFDQMSEKNK